MAHFGIVASYSVAAWTVAANYGTWDVQFPLLSNTAFDMSGFGLSVGYDLGGGATVQAGYGSSDFSNLLAPFQTDADVFSFGIAMSF